MRAGCAVLLVALAPLGQTAASEGRRHLRLERDLRGPAEEIGQVCAPWREVRQGQCPQAARTNLCAVMPELCQGGTHRRCEMPQIPSPPHAGEPPTAAWGEWAERLQAKGVAYELAADVLIGTLVNNYTSSQTQLDACEVCEIFHSASRCFEPGSAELPSSADCQAEAQGCFCAWDSNIAVASVGMKVLDGHHRWAAALLLSKALPDGLRAGFLAQTTRVQSYGASVERLRALSAQVESVNETACNEFAAP